MYTHLLGLHISEKKDWYFWYRGWCIKFATGLNIIIAIVPKVYEWSSFSFCQNDSLMGGISLITHILFELCLFWYLAQLQNWCTTLYVSSTIFTKLIFRDRIISLYSSHRRQNIQERIFIIWAAQPGPNGQLSCLHSFKIFWPM